LRYEQLEPCGLTASEISSIAFDAARQLNFRPGDELDTVMDRLNGEIKYLSIVEGKNSSIAVEKGGKFTIWLLPSLFPLQKRMVIAHELGHFYLHSKCGEVAIEASYNSEGQSEMVEDEVRQFAYEFLMPADELRQVAERFDRDSVRVAAHFMVPEPVARKRMMYVDCR